MPTDTEIMDWLDETQHEGEPRIGIVYDHWWHMAKDATIRDAIKEVAARDDDV